MKHNKLFWVVSCIVLISLTGCADSVTFGEAMTIQPVGFWYGLWHGITFPFAFIGSLFVDSISIYAIYNNGGWYDFGFWLGAAGLASSTNATRKR